MRNLASRTFIALILSALASTSCSLKSSSQTALHIEIPHNSTLSRSATKARVASTAGNYQAAPANLSDFDCYAVNVTAMDIPAANPKQCSLASDMIGVPGGWMPAQASASVGSVGIDLLVPDGPNRLIQIYGVRTPDACPRLGDFNSTRLGDIYLLGSVTTDIFNDMSVSIKASLDPSKKAFSSCKSGAATTLADVTYYVLGPTGTAVNLPLPNNTQYTLASVGVTSKGVTTAVDDGTHTKFSYNPNMSTGTDQFTYTATDTSGAIATGKVIIKNVTPFTWTGATGDSQWNTVGNWCGFVNAPHTNCSNTGAAPATGDKAIFDGTCVGTNCNATISVASTTINTLFLDHDYTGTLTQSAASTTFTVTNLLDLKGGTLLLNNVGGSFYVPGNLTIDGGNLISGTSNSSLGLSSGVTLTAGLLDLSLASSISTGAFTMSGGTFHAPENGAVTFNGAFAYSNGTFNAGSTASAYSYILNGTGSASTINVGPGITFQKLGVFSNSAAEAFSVNGIIHVLNELKLNGVSGASSPPLNGGSISVEGNLSVDSGFSGYTGNTQILLTGAGTQTISDSTAASYPHIAVNKAGTLNINSSSPITLQMLIATEVQHNGSGALTLPSGNIYPGKLTQNSAGAMTYPSGGTINGDFQLQAGTVNLGGVTNITGTLTLQSGTTIHNFGNSLTYGALSNLGGLIGF